MNRSHGPGWMLILIAGMLVLGGCRAMTNYEEAAMPRFDGRHARGGLTFDGTLDVVTWNIRFSQEIEAAIAELTSIPELIDADVLMLQEMDETGVWTIARTLAYDYVYFPASLHTRNDKNFGNAVLSKWSIVDAEKILLPHRNPRNDQARIAVRATIDVAGIDVVVYSVHTETPWLGPERREDQIESSIDSIDATDEHVVVGGDFNTVTPQGVAELTDLFAAAGFTAVSAGTGPTFTAAGVGLTTDHIFARGFDSDDAGVMPETAASDHQPLWARLTFRID